ncbi:MAG: YbjQ family protein [Psychrosphaera sp.]|nr:YbjQ family protein [Psychrosphaera sp.]
MSFDNNANKYLAGTRPEIKHSRILMTKADGFDGYEIMEYFGMVWGISVRAKDMGQDCAMGCKSITGGELTSYSKLGDESRQRAIDLMLKMADRKSANAIINVDFEMSGNAQGAAEVVVNGTAVKIEPIPNYVPTGALGNVINDLKDGLLKDK